MNTRDAGAALDSYYMDGQEIRRDPRRVIDQRQLSTIDMTGSRACLCMQRFHGFLECSRWVLIDTEKETDASAITHYISDSACVSLTHLTILLTPTHDPAVVRQFCRCGADPWRRSRFMSLTIAQIPDGHFKCVWMLTPYILFVVSQSHNTSGTVW